MAAHGRLIFWFRQDLRLSDLPALVAAQRDAEEIIPLYVLDDAAAGDWSSGAASRWWLHQSLTALGSDIAARAGQLVLRSGDSLSALQELCAESGADAVYCSRRYEPWASAQEEQLHAELDKSGVLFKRFPGSLLHEPGRVLTQAGGPFKVFTPFWRACLRQELAVPAPRVDPEWSLTSLACATEQLDDWKLCPRDPDWAADWGSLWQPGETGARERLRAFLAAAVGDYSAGRDYPGAALTSRLSAHLHHGELSPRQVWAACEQRKLEAPETAAAIGKFQSELGWREFSYHLLHFFPGIPETPFKGGFRGFPWVSAPPALKSWQQGQTGYPIVDAGMRELWQTGCMHNRVRMVVASFLCKHLLQHWREGANWFWDTLVDADLASNSCSWQWVAGSGADAAPYFRIFNPVAQGEKFDKDGVYVRRWVPEIAKLPNKYLHKPWEAPPGVLKEARINLGTDYPQPIVDHRSARRAALDAYDTIRGQS